MKFKILVEYEYPVEHKLPVTAELILHGDRVVTDNIKPLEQEPVIRDNGVKDELNQVKDEFEPTTKNDLGVDCISRKAAEDITWQDPSYTDPLNILTEVRDKIRELPSVTPQEPRWIPVSERLPENKTYVLVTIGIPGRQRHARSGWYQDGFFHNDNGDCWSATDIEVKAWMPLPKPYEPQESEDKK